MWFEQEAGAAHLEQVRSDLVHDLVAGLAGAQPPAARPPRRRRTWRGSRPLALLLHRRSTSYPCAHAMAHAGGRT